MKTHKNGVTLVEVLVSTAIVLLFIAIMCIALKGLNPAGSTPAGYPAGTRVTRIDGCEYLESGFYDNFSRTHKGNCDNPAHHSNSNVEK